MVQQSQAGNASDDGCEAWAGVSMMDLIGHALSAEERGCSVAATGIDTANGGGGRLKGAPVPPWLLMAMMSASQSQGPVVAPGVAGTGAPPSSGGGGPVTAAPEVGLRNSLERRVAESLRSLDSVRALLQDPAGSARQGTTGGAGGASRSGADDEAAGRLAALTADVDPATALFEGTLREWLACRRRGKGGGELRSRRPWEGSGLGRRGGESPRTVPEDALALAFRCEAAGDAEAMVGINGSVAGWFALVLLLSGCLSPLYLARRMLSGALRLDSPFG